MLGLRKNIDYKTAVQLAEHNPVVGGVSYAATQMIRSPLFQRLAAGIDETAKNQTLGSIDETCGGRSSDANDEGIEPQDTVFENDILSENIF